jgi:hypothetical protein
MGRKHTAGSVGNQAVGGVQVDNTTLSAADNLDITVDPSGTGIFKVAGDTQIQAQGDLRFADADSSNWVAFQAPTTISSNVTWTLPSTDGTNTQALTTNGSGVLSWATNSVVISNETADASTNYVTFTTTTSGQITTAKVSNTKLTFQPSSGTLTSTILSSTGNTTVGANLNITGIPSITGNFPVYQNQTSMNSYTIPAGTNAMSAGPITIAAGQTVTVNGDWSIV